MTQQPSDSSTRNRALNAALLATPGELELTVAASRVEGRIPSALHAGRLLSNGPGWTKIGGRVAHPFDGHGYVRAFSFEQGGSVRLRARFVDTPVYREEASLGRLTRRGLGTNPSRHFWKNLLARKDRNVANTTVQRWNGALLAAWEGGTPYRVDPDSLATLGAETFGGALAGQATLAHMKVDAEAKRLVTCSVKLGRTTQLTFREMSEDGRQLSTREVVLPSTLFVHDFVVTPHWYGVVGNPVTLKLGTFALSLAGGRTLIEAIATKADAPGTLLLFSRKGDAVTRTLALPGPAFAVHYGNAFERDDEVVVDACVSGDVDIGSAFGFRGPSLPLDVAKADSAPTGRLTRIVAKAGATTATCTELTPYGLDFPRVHPAHDGRETPLLFGAARADERHSFPFDSVAGVDLRDRERPVDLWTAPENVLVGEPIFAPSEERDDAGHVLVVLYDGLRSASSLAIFEANALAQGPVARVPLPLLPYAFHGAWDRAR